MLVVSDTSPLNYLILVDAIDVLPVLFQAVCVPPIVLKELGDLRSPDAVRIWAENPPAWLHIQSPKAVRTISGLHDGEVEAIALFEELAADVLLIDDRVGKREAARRGIPVMGTLGVLAQAVTKNLIGVTDASNRLRQTNFRGRIELLSELVQDFRNRPDNIE